MHSSRELRSSAFDVRVEGAPAALAGVLDGFEASDRVGIVARRPCAVVGCSALLMAAITAFYDVQRARSEDFFVYPDYFVFHVARRLGRHNRLDVWPPHKEVVVADEPEELLRAINDRGITRLLVEDGAPGERDGFARETLASARGRIRTALAYSATGRVRDADVAIASNDVVETYVEGVLAQSEEVPLADRERIAAARTGLREDARPAETYRRIGLGEALGLLVPRPERRLVAV
jgi:hypothetical protein